MLGPFQLCDAPRDAAAADELITEARTRRLLPGAGRARAVGADRRAAARTFTFGVEVPLASQRPDLDPGARLALLVSATREFLQRRNA